MTTTIKKLKDLDKKISKLKQITIEDHQEIFDDLMNLQMVEFNEVFEELRNKLNEVQIIEPKEDEVESEEIDEPKESK